MRVFLVVVNAAAAAVAAAAAENENYVWLVFCFAQRLTGRDGPSSSGV